MSAPARILGPNKARQKAYSAWYAARSRCHNSRHPQFKNWGGRGIEMDDSWRNSFEAFVRDMGLPVYQSDSLDRENNDGPYSKSNCRWIHLSEQPRNSSRAKLTHRLAESIRKDWKRNMKQREIAAKYGVSGSRVSAVVHGDAW